MKTAFAWKQPLAFIAAALLIALLLFAGYYFLYRSEARQAYFFALMALKFILVIGLLTFPLKGYFLSRHKER